jgi:hypothetical protein
MPIGPSISIVYAQWLKDGLHALLQSSGQGEALPWDSVAELLKETLWEMEGILRSAAFQGDDHLLFFALYQRLCSQKFGTKGVFTLEAYPSELLQENLLAEALKGRPGMVSGSMPISSGSRRFSRLGLLLLLMYLIGSSLLGTYWYVGHQRTKSQLEEKDKAYQALLQDYEKVYDAYYQLETKFVQLSKRPYKKFSLSDTVRHIGADIHWFADEGEVMMNIDSLPPLAPGFVYMVFARTAREVKPIGSFEQSLKMFEMGDFEPVANPLGFVIKQVKGDSGEVVVSSK